MVGISSSCLYIYLCAHFTIELGHKRDRRICRSPQEIAILIIRLVVPNPEARNDDQLPLEREKEFLKNFISELQGGDWNSRCKPDDDDGIRIPGTVPKVVCLDETWQRIGATRPSWPDQKPKALPWGELLTDSRHARTLGPSELRSHI